MDLSRFFGGGGFNVMVATGFIWCRLAVLVNIPVEMQIKALRWCSSSSGAVGCTLACHRCLWLHRSKNQPTCSFHLSPHAAFTSIHSPSEIKLQQQGLMSSLIVLNVWWPQFSPSLSSMLSGLLPVSFLHHLCSSSTSSHCRNLFSITLQCFFLPLLPHSWTKSRRHIQKQMILMSRL